MKKCLFTLLTMLSLCTNLAGEEVVVRTAGGEDLILEVSPEDSFADVMHYINAYADQHQEMDLAFADETTDSRGYMIMLGGLWKKKDKGGGSSKPLPAARDFDINHITVTAEEKEHITYIVTTLAQTGVLSLYDKQKDLEDRGKLVKHIHPLRFLFTIMEDPTLRGNFRTVRDRSNIVWKRFRDDLTESLAQESRANNMKTEYVEFFGNTLGLNTPQLVSTVKNKQWNEFLEVLLKSIAKNGNRWD